MIIEEALKNFPTQFLFEPKIENKTHFKRFDKFIVCGMGGSHLAADLLKVRKPKLDSVVYSDYGLPPLEDEELRTRLIIISSYSGNTEESIDVFYKALEKKLPLAAISMGGKVLEIAKKYNVPYVQIPDTDIEPRLGLGFSIRGTIKLMGKEEMLQETKVLANELDVSLSQKEGEELAKILENKIPVIYSSRRNCGIAYNWKIKFGETAKIPAFYNVVPELNHNEMNGFDVRKKTRALSKDFYFLFLEDAEDHPRIKIRMNVLKKLYEERGLAVLVKELKGTSVWHKIFSSLLMADWASYALAKHYNVPTECVLVEEFKKLL